MERGEEMNSAAWAGDPLLWTNKTKEMFEGKEGKERLKRRNRH